MIKLFLPTDTNFSTNGLIPLNNCISCIITEELNGMYECAIEYPIEAPVLIDSIIPCSKSLLVGAAIVGTRGKANLSPKFGYIQKDYIIFADNQPFRIYNVKRNMSSIIVTARHIFYDLLDNFLADCNILNFTGLHALQYMLSSTQYAHLFTCNGDVTNNITNEFIRKNVVDSIMGTDSIISTCKGELVRDNFNIGLWQHRGNDNGVLIMGGKNLIGITDILDQDNVCTRLMPVGKEGLLLTEKYIDSQYINSYPHPKVKTIDFSDIIDAATLRATAIQYMSDNKIDIPIVNYTVDFVELSKTVEYKNYAILQSVVDGDTVTIRYDKLNLDIKAEVIKTIKRYVNGIWIYDKVELGNFKGNIVTVLGNMANNMTNDGKIKASNVQGIIDATKATFQALSSSAETQTEKAILFEDNDITSPTYGAMCIGTSGFEIASVKTNSQWVYETFGTGKGFIADCIIAGKMLGGCAEFNLDEGFLKITHSDGSYTLIDANGFNRYIGGTGKEYHYLMQSGNINPVQTTIWQTQPLGSEFANKPDIQVIVQLTAFDSSTSGTCSGAYAQLGVVTTGANPSFTYNGWCNYSMSDGAAWISLSWIAIA